MIEIERLTVRFGGVTPIDDLTLTLKSAIAGLVGPNGAGKTTLINVISGFVRPAAGSIRLFGDDIVALPAHARHDWGLGRSFQTPRIAEDLTVADNIRVVLDRDSVPRAERDARLIQILEAADLTGKARRLGGTLDGFDVRRVEIARALAGNPRLVLLDEPGAGLAHEEREQLIGLIRGVAENHDIMVLLIDHDMDLIASVCEEIAVLDFGKLIAIGPTRDMLADRRVKAAYLGELEMA
jgi:ABC-type branched-subunit amino acid transport system ATPase component